MLEEFEYYYRTTSSGVYALYLENIQGLKIFKDEVAIRIKNRLHNNLLYIGMSSNLYRRIENQHLRRTPNSTLRRTIAQLLNMELINRKLPNLDNDLLITNWLKRNTYFMIYETGSKQETVTLEKKLIDDLQPPFNKLGCRDLFD